MAAEAEEAHDTSHPTPAKHLHTVRRTFVAAVAKQNNRTEDKDNGADSEDMHLSTVEYSLGSRPVVVEVAAAGLLAAGHSEVRSRDQLADVHMVLLLNAVAVVVTTPYR
jgi:hypothetical protein